MPNRHLSRATAIAATAAMCTAALILGACSQNAGFGAPPVPAPPQPAPQAAAPVGGSPGASPSSSASPGSAQDLTIISATGRYAYDGAESDPVKTQHLIELAFALKNATSKAVTIAKLSASSDTGTAIGDEKLNITVAPGATTDVTLVAFKPKKDIPYIKSVSMSFTDDKAKVLALGNADLPPTDLPFVPLDQKDPKGGASIDGIEITRVAMPGSGLHYEVTFAMTNAGVTRVDIDGFAILAPNTPPFRVNIPLSIPQRTTTGFISVVVPFKGKALPDGDYSLNALNAGATVAKSSGALL